MNRQPDSSPFQNALALAVVIVALILFLQGCSLAPLERTDTYLPSPPTPESERLTLEKQERSWLYAWTHPLSKEAQDRGKVFQGFSLGTTGH